MSILFYSLPNEKRDIFKPYQFKLTCCKVNPHLIASLSNLISKHLWLFKGHSNGSM